MGLSSGHTFTDGETVTAAKLNNLVNNGTITTNTITTGMLLDDSVTSAKLAPNAVTGASISANTINLSTLSNASGGTSGTLVQSGSGGVFEELSPGATGTVLVSGGTDAALSFGTIDNVAIGATMISGHTEVSDPGQDDLLLVKDKVAGVNKSVQIQNLYKTVNDLTALSSSDIANPDEFLVIDGGSAPKKITYQNLQTATLASINDLPALTDATVADNDSLLVYDTSASEVKKISKSELGTGGSMLQVTVPLTASSTSSSLTHAITSSPSSNDSGVVIVYDVTVTGVSYPWGSAFGITLPDAGPYLNEGIKTLELVHKESATNNVRITIAGTDSDGNTVLNNPSSGSLSSTYVYWNAGVIIKCTPFVLGGNHYWTVKMDA